MPMDAVFVLTVAILAFGGIAAALAWAEAQNREPSKITTPQIAVARIEPRCPLSKIRECQFSYLCEATFSSPTRCIHSHEDELRVSSLVPEIEAPAPAPAPTPPAPAGAFFWAAVGDRINRHHVIEPLLPAFAMLSGRNEIG